MATTAIYFWRLSSVTSPLLPAKWYRGNAVSN